LRYRPDIDGLRALAVLAVVGFHAFPSILSGGFVGVDVFFVISGYLITGIIHSGLERKCFSLADFYRRRVRRIFPALLLVLAFSLIMGWHILLDSEFRQLGKHLLAGAGFSSNFVLWGESGYFDGASDRKPLLHLWSLGIEEQFYLLWPLLLMLAHRLGGKERIVAAFIAASSLILTLYLSNAETSAAFYSPLTRAWELALGAFLAFPRTELWLRQLQEIKTGSDATKVRARLNPERLAWLGLFLIALAILCLDRSRPYPGWASLLPTLGTAAVIAAGPETWISSRVLARRPMVAIGLISYPLYLWHWPLLAFARISEPNGISVPATLAILASAFALAWATYRLIEAPVRRGLVRPWLLLCGMTLFGIFGLGCFIGMIRPWSASFDLEKIVAIEHDPIFPGDFLQPFHFSRQIFYGEGSGSKKTLLIGDSTMEETFLRVHALLQMEPVADRSVVFATKTGCAPIPGIEAEKDHRWCGQFARDAFAFALDSSVDTVVIGVNWYGYFSNTSDRVEYVFRDETGRYPLGLESEGSRLAYAVLSRRIGDLVRAKKAVYLILNTPFGKELDPANIVQRSFWRGFEIHSNFVNKQRFLEKTSVVSRPLREIALKNGATAIDPVSLLCDDNICPALTTDGYPRYRDVVHLRTTFLRDHVTYLDSTFGLLNQPSSTAASDSVSGRKN